MGLLDTFSKKFGFTTEEDDENEMGPDETEIEEDEEEDEEEEEAADAVDTIPRGARGAREGCRPDSPGETRAHPPPDRPSTWSHGDRGGDRDSGHSLHTSFPAKVS